MHALKRLLLLQIGPSPWEFLLALLALVCGMYCFFGWPDPGSLTAGRMLFVAAFFLALDGLRTGRLLPLPGRIAACLFVLYLGITAWGVLAEAAQSLSSAGP